MFYGNNYSSMVAVPTYTSSVYCIVMEEISSFFFLNAVIYFFSTQMFVNKLSICHIILSKLLNSIGCHGIMFG